MAIQSYGGATIAIVDYTSDIGTSNPPFSWAEGTLIFIDESPYSVYMSLGGYDYEAIFTQAQADWNQSDNTQPSYIANKPSIPAAQVNSDWNAVSGVAQILNKPTIPTIPSRSFTNNASRSIVSSGSGFQISTSRDCSVSYAVSISTTISLTGSSGGYVALQVSSDNSTWQEVSRVTNAQGGSLVVGLSLNQTIGGVLGAIVPANYYARILSVNTATGGGTPTYAFSSGQEVLL
jgi:hypothetical protein